MAMSIPDRIRGNPAIPKPRQDVGGALVADLSEAATVWYGPPFDPDGALPHFVVLDPAIGLLVVMVFDQRSGQAALQAASGQLRVEGSDEIDNPLERATEFGHRLQEKIAGEPALPDVPITGLAAFPYLQRDEAEVLGFDTALDLDHCLFRADLEASRRGEGGLEQRMSRLLEGGLPEPLAEKEEGAVRGLLHPEVVIQAPEQASLFTAPSPSEDRAELFRVMDRRQELMAKDLGSGHRVIRGVAGSGKTLVLVSRARLLARLMPSQRILVACYNRSLAGLLQAYLAEYPNVEVRTVHSLMRHVIQLAGDDVPTNLDEWSTAVGPAVERLRAAGSPPLPQYRAVLIDEAQDCNDRELQFLVSLAQEVDGEQDVLVVSDSAQSIYRRGFTWKQAGIRAQGRTRILRVNYRNTREILAFSHDFLTADASVEVDAAPEHDDNVTVIEAESAERSGPAPRVDLLVDDVDEEIDAVVSEVRSALRPDSPARSVAVLYVDGREDDRAARLFEALKSVKPTLLWSNAPAAQGEPNPKDLLGATESRVVLSTVGTAA